MLFTYSIIAIGAIIITFFLFWRFYFLRDPNRMIPHGRVIVSPADGKVITVFKDKNAEQVIHKRFIGKIRTLCSDVGEDCSIISIFMSPLDVHINRSPIDGEVASVKHSPGRLLAVNTLEAGLQNEKVEMLLKTAVGKIKVIQVAGLIARRIVCYVQKGQKLKRGERFGLINLGSQLIVILPKNVEIIAQTGQKVRAGESIIARYQ